MTFSNTTGQTIQQAFETYHNANPIVYDHFKRLAFEAINKGKKKLSFKMIMNVIRWNIYIQTEEPTLFTLDNKPVKFKLNDIYGSRYARLFISDFPIHKDKIELRELRS